MPDPSPAEELRSAASLMRKRAETATAGPWLAEAHPQETVDCVVNQGGWLVAECATEDVEHIASWSPPPALAVAELLDHQAAALDAGVTDDDGELFHDGGCTGKLLAPGEELNSWDTRCTCFDDAFTIARTYLGTERDAGELEAVPGE